MAAHTSCLLCENPGTLAEAVDVGKVTCNVRRFQDKVFTLWRCTGCSSLHCAEDADLALYYAEYPLKHQKVGLGEHIGYANRLRLIKRQGFREKDRILDFGCGAGLFVNWLRDKGLPQVSGYDMFVPAYHHVETLNETYDAVVSYDVIEHDDDPLGFVKRIGPLVRSGGLLVIGTPNADNVSVHSKGDPSLHVPYHRHILSERVLLALGQQQGFEPVHIHRRSFYDSLFPTVNSRFLWSYIAKTGLLDTAVEPPRTGLVLRSPKLLLFAFLGFFLPRRDYILVTFRKR
jgi:2-polyprenyl-3-methyl-5-hydroxy-6-metoxy-1,4-benzoquinol methylase